MHIRTQKLSADQKERYKQKAKNLPAKSVQVAPKYTTQGVPLELYEREQQDAIAKQKYMERKVRDLVQNGFLDNGKFETIHSLCFEYEIRLIKCINVNK